MSWFKTATIMSEKKIPTVGGVPDYAHPTYYQINMYECDDVSDLANITVPSNVVLAMGSQAHIIATNSFYTMQSNNTWCIQEMGTAGYTKAEVDQMITRTETYAVNAVSTALNTLDVSSVGGATRYIYQISETNGKISASSYASDASPTAGSTKLIQSGGVKTYVDNAKASANSYTDTQVATKASINDVFGMGGNTYIPDASDLNTYTQAGVYIRQFSSGLSDFTNLPMDGSTYAYQPFRLVVEYLNSPNNIIQTLIPTYSNCSYFKRVRIFGASGTWQPWVYFSGTPVTP